jgi:hypothetical protein
VSIGEGCYGIVVRNCVIWKTESGIGVKDSPGGRPPCTAILYGNTITDSEFGIRCYNKSNPASPTDGGRVTNSFHNIIFGNLSNVALFNGGTMVAEYSDIGGGFPGVGNIDADPLWVNPLARDYRLQAGSPALGAGLGGTNLGVPFPVGGIPMWVSHLAAVSFGSNEVVLSWQENADNESGFSIERSTDRLLWSAVGGAPVNARSYADLTGAPGVNYYYRVRATNDSGVSPFSNVASGASRSLSDSDSDGMPDDWELAHGLLPDDPSDASTDADIDGMNNLQEFLAGTDPQDPASRLFLHIESPNAREFELQFTAISNKTYTLQFRTNVAAGDWLLHQNILGAPTNRLIILTNSPTDPARFFRVLTPSAP